jgi:Ricin-type beta-trefoil lectin domain
VDGAGRAAARGFRGSSPRLKLRVRATLVVAGIAGAGLTALPALTPAAPVIAATVSASPAAVRGGSAGSALASAQFVTRPQVTASGSGLRQGCATPVTPGQMACMVLIRRGVRMAGPDAASTGGYTPQDLQGAYGSSAAAGKPANGETIAVVDAFNDPNAASDLAQYRAKFGLPACTTASGCLTIMNEYGGTKLPKSDPSGGWELEESLDLDMVSAICPGCSIVLLEADSASISDLAVAERTASRVPGVNAVSNSWGSGAEFIGENQFDQDFYAPGVAIVAAGGDDGYGTQYPAVSPYVTSAGGTSLLGSGSSWTQSAWNGVGSGCSSLEPKPSWQTEDDTSPDGCQNRTDNDVSADADPLPGVAIYDSVKDSDVGGVPDWTSVGGTSVATAIIAATYALADIVAGGPSHGLISGTFPAAYPYQAAAGLTDVTGGSNGSCESYRRYLCTAVTGYDGPTGLGTPSGTSAFTAKSTEEVTIADPGTLVVAGGAKLYMALNFEPGTESPTFSTTPSSLPGSLYVDPYGFLRGSAPTKPGIYSIKVSAAVSGLGTGTTSFRLVVTPAMRAAHPGTGEVRLSGASHCLTVSGSKVKIEACTSHSDQQWEFVPGGSLAGTGQLKNHGNCLVVGAGSGAKAGVQKCSKSTRQQWTYQGLDRFRNAAANLCLAIRGGAAAGKQPVDWACGAASSWQLPGAPVLLAVSGRCLNDPGARNVSGTRIQVSSCSPAPGQRWISERNQTLEIAGKCLAVNKSSMLDGAAAVLAKCTGKAPQQWLRGPNGQLMNANSGRCLADPNNSARSGTDLVQDDCYSLPGEIWTVS